MGLCDLSVPTQTASIERPEWALLLGGADCLWSDVRAVLEMIGGPWPGLVVACNDAGAHWPGRLDHWVTLHPEKWPARARDGSGDWIRRRRAAGHPDGYELWTRKKSDHVESNVLEQWGPGSSGFLMVPVAHAAIAVCSNAAKGRGILCGVPMDASPHFHSPAYWRGFDRHRRAWRENLPRLGWLRAMSGWTSEELLGRPDREWLEAS